MRPPIPTVGREAVQVMTPTPRHLAESAWSLLLIDPDWPS
jgi:hypothetical protein